MPSLRDCCRLCYPDMRAIVALVVLCAGIFGDVCSAQDVVGVGGFISASAQLQQYLSANGLPRPDYSSARVELLTSTGVKKHEAECTPNGYYFMPVEDAGVYILKVGAPKGWSFTPSQSEVVCDATSCNKGGDVNFKISGFSLQGTVEGATTSGTCESGAEAPAGVTITLLDSTGAVLSSTSTSADGRYTLGGLQPGNYIVRSSHAEWAVQPAQLSATVAWDNAQVAEPFRVAGYRVTGKITSPSGPVAGVAVLLYSTDTDDIACSAVQPPPAGIMFPEEGKLLCAATSDSKGIYSFLGVPCGRYSLVPVHGDTAAGFDIQPHRLQLAVQQANLVVKEQFNVVGFSVNGRVVDSSGAGIDAVVVSIDSKPRATSAADGTYSLSSMQAGKYRIGGSKEGMEFAELAGVEVTPAAKQLPDLALSRVQLCGSVQYQDAQFAVPRVLRITSTAGWEGTANVDASGHFCTMLAPGTYQLLPQGSSEERSRGLIFGPPYQDVTLGNSPLSGVSFTQAKLTLSGTVRCLEPPCESATVLLLASQDTGAVVRRATLGQVRTQDSEAATSWAISGLAPGRYRLSGERPGWCWESSGVDVVLEAADATAPPLQQLGYVAQVNLSHEAVLDVSGPTGAVNQYSFQQGGHAICLAGVGSFHVEPRSCYHFGQERFTLATSALQPLSLTATRVMLNGSVILATTAQKPVIVQASSSKTKAASEVVASPLDDNGASLHYSLLVDVGSSVVLEPSSLGLLFYPRRRTVRHSGASCPPPVPEFYGRLGHFVHGTIRPQVEGAVVEVYYESGSAAGEVGVAGELAGSALTLPDGTFSVGPLYDDAKYTASASKPGWSIEAGVPDQGGHWLFTAKKLAQVRVEVAVEGAAERGGVLLSLSGDHGYKHNARLGEDGTFTFHSMAPGTYYLRPQLKEYAFQPAVAEVEVREGQDTVVSFTSQRTAYSLMGTVLSISGLALPGVVVEAALDGSVVETAVSSEDGSFRVQGLRPGSSYTLSVRTDDEVEIAYPPSTKVTIGGSDTAGVRFTAFRWGGRGSVTGVADVPSEWVSSAVLEVVAAGSNRGAKLRTILLDATPFFEVKGLRAGSYALKLSCSPVPQQYDCEGNEVTVSLGTSDVAVEGLALKVRQKAQPQELDGVNRSAPLLVLGTLVAMAVWQRHLLADVFQLRPPQNKGTEATSEGEWLQQSSKKRAVPAKPLSRQTSAPTPS